MPLCQEHLQSVCESCALQHRESQLWRTAEFGQRTAVYALTGVLVLGVGVDLQSEDALVEPGAQRVPYVLALAGVEGLEPAPIGGRISLVKSTSGRIVDE